MRINELYELGGDALIETEEALDLYKEIKRIWIDKKQTAGFYLPSLEPAMHFFANKLEVERTRLFRIWFNLYSDGICGYPDDFSGILAEDMSASVKWICLSADVIINEARKSLGADVDEILKKLEACKSKLSETHVKLCELVEDEGT